MAVKTKTKQERRGGARPNAGRKPEGKRCPCGVMSLKRAQDRFHHCKRTDRAAKNRKKRA